MWFGWDVVGGEVGEGAWRYAPGAWAPRRGGGRWLGEWGSRVEGLGGGGNGDGVGVGWWDEVGGVLEWWEET